MNPFIVADIGGTNARFALARVAGAGDVLLEHVVTFPTREHASFEDCMSRYLSGLDVPGPLDACLAVAGPAVDNAVTMTNLQWRVDGERLAGRLGLGQVQVINDFVAMAWSTSDTRQLDLMRIRPGQSHRGPRLVIGPGTGLGVCALVPVGGGWVEVPGEGGHVRCPAYAAFPDGVWEQLKASHPGLFIEQVLSGRGIENLHHAMMVVSGADSSARTPMEITAAVGEDPLSARTVSVFCDLLGCVARDFALTFGAMGGVYLAGGILPRFHERLLASRFAEHFSDHPIYAEHLSRIPVALIRCGESAMMGAARWFTNPR